MANGFSFRNDIDLSDQGIFGGIPGVAGLQGADVNAQIAGKSPSYIDRGRSTITQSGMNAAKQGMVAEGIGAAAQIGGSLIQAGIQNAENRRNREEAKRLAEMQRADDLAALSTNNNIRKKQMEQEQESFKIQKFVDQQNLKYQTFMKEINKQLANRDVLKNAASFLQDRVSNNQQLGNAIVGLWRK